MKEETIDAKVRHILQTLIAFGALDTPREDKSIDKDNAQSKEIALDLAREGVVLLKMITVRCLTGTVEHW